MTSVVVLAGGEGRRMGGNKPLHPWNGTTLIEATLDRLRRQSGTILVNALETHADAMAGLGLRLLFDDPATAGRGPLSGVLSALQWAKAHDEAFVITAPCDMPRLPGDMVARLQTAPDADVVYFSGARDYPLCARWRTGLRPRLAEAVANADGGLRVMAFLTTCDIVSLASDDDDFVNINTPEDLCPR